MKDEIVDSATLRRVAAFVVGVSQVLNRDQIRSCVDHSDYAEPDEYALRLAQSFMAPWDFDLAVRKRAADEADQALKDRLAVALAQNETLRAELEMQRVENRAIREMKLDELRGPKP